MQELTELKNLVIQSLEANGSLAKIRAQIRASVFNVVDQQDGQQKKSPFFWENNKAQSIYELQQGKDMLEIIKEFLLFYDMHYTNSIFSRYQNSKIYKTISESNLREDVNRENIAKKLGIDAHDQTKPLLYYLLNRKPQPPQKNEQLKVAQPSPKDIHQVQQQQRQDQQQQLKAEQDKQRQELLKQEEIKKKQQEIKEQQIKEQQLKDQQFKEREQQKEQQLKKQLEEQKKQQEQQKQKEEQQRLEKEKQEKLRQDEIKRQQQEQKEQKRLLEEQKLQQQQEIMRQEDARRKKLEEEKNRKEQQRYEDEKYQGEQIGEDIDDDQQVGESDEYMQQSQSQGIDMTVDSAALEEFDYYEDVEELD